MTSFELISRAMFEERGLKSTDAFLMASKLKYGPYSSSYVSQKHDISNNNNAWLDRVLAECAKLEVLEKQDYKDAQFNELADLTGHSEVLRGIKKEEEKIQDLISIVKSERTKGFLACKSCKSMDSVQIDQKQTRSSDEPMTLFALCDACGFQWTVKT
jgi:DNA-directed RNA polymerase subunit M/transcription elongation factor TFIIS